MLGSEVQVRGLSHTANAFIRVRAVAFTGTDPTTIRIRAWADGATEPTTWQYTVTDSSPALQVPGTVGLRAYFGTAVTNAPVVFGFDDLIATSVGAVTGVCGSAAPADGPGRPALTHTA